MLTPGGWLVMRCPQFALGWGSLVRVCDEVQMRCANGNYLAAAARLNWARHAIPALECASTGPAMPDFTPYLLHFVEIWFIRLPFAHRVVLPRCWCVAPTYRRNTQTKGEKHEVIN